MVDNFYQDDKILNLKNDKCNQYKWYILENLILFCLVIPKSLFYVFN